MIKFAEVKVGEIAKKHILDCLDRNWVTKGCKTELLEGLFAQTMKYDRVVAVNSGTSADLLACLSLYSIDNGSWDETQPGDEIICPALCFIACANSIFAAGFKPVFCDIKRETLNIDEDKVESLITPNTRAILAVNTMGRACNMAKLREICDKYNLILISDNCEGHFCQFQGKMMTEWADVVTYSCYAAHLVFAAEMGFCCTNRQDIWESLIANRTHGRPRGDLLFNHPTIGWNAKPTDLHASVGLESILNIQETLNIRRNNLRYLIGHLAKYHDIFHIGPIDEGDYNFMCPHALSLTFKEDNEERFTKFYKYLQDNNIDPKLNFKSIPTQQGCYAWLGYQLGDFPEAEFVGRNGLHLPVHQYLTEDDLNYMIKKIEEFVNG